jgi:hypothetical protein
VPRGEISGILAAFHREDARMKNGFLLAAACTAAVSAAALAAGPFDQFKDRMKAGQYEMKMEMEMPGMPAGVGKQNMTFMHCVTPEDIENGKVGRGRDGKSPENCEIKNFKMSGNTATYQMVCTGKPDMTADNKITFADNGYKMDMKATMNQGGQVMNMTQHMESRYVGPCKK